MKGLCHVMVVPYQTEVTGDVQYPGAASGVTADFLSMCRFVAEAY